jgi:hypothetical protein
MSRTYQRIASCSTQYVRCVDLSAASYSWACEVITKLETPVEMRSPGTRIMSPYACDSFPSPQNFRNEFIDYQLVNIPLAYQIPQRYATHFHWPSLKTSKRNMTITSRTYAAYLLHNALLPQPAAERGDDAISRCAGTLVFFTSRSLQRARCILAAQCEMPPIGTMRSHCATRKQQ